MKSIHNYRVPKPICWIALILFCSTAAFASFAGDVRGVVRDPQEAPVAGATVTLRSRTSYFVRTAQTSGVGEFVFRAVPLGEYTLSVEQKGFSRLERSVIVVSDNAPMIEFDLKIAPITQQVEVELSPDRLISDPPRPTTLVSRDEIEHMPGADRTNSLAFITNNVPGAYMTHNQLHVRGGHQVTWLIDGVPVPNTNIADTVGAQFDPKDMDYVEVQRGGYSAENGDRTYAVFNVVPRSGFERNREGEIVASFGNFRQGAAQVNFGDHTKRFAYYLSLSGNRSDYGLETPTADVINDAENGFGGFGSFLYHPSTNDELRLVTALRRDIFRVPNDREAQDLGVRDVERERDGFFNFSWVHTFGTSVVFTGSPFYHYNRADFIGGPNDMPVSARSERTSEYAGGQAVLSLLTERHNAKIGYYGFFQRDRTLFAVTGIDELTGPVNLTRADRPSGGLQAAFAEDQFKPVSWLTLTGGVRFTHFHGSITENSTSPRVGFAVRVPRANVVLHGFYGRYYQAPPLTTVSGPLLEYVIDQGFGIIPLRGERDEEYQLGISVPVKGWVVASDYFQTMVRNFFDHNALGNSNIFFPLTIERARIRGFEVTVKSPLVLGRARISFVYSNQIAEGKGAVSGGLTDFEQPEGGYFFLDHDQRNTFNVNFTTDLGFKAYLSASVRYGSGFLDGEGPNHLPGHTLLDLSFGRRFGDKWTISVQAVNVANSRFLLDNSETFGGTHFVEPRQIYIQVRRRFHF